jgi:hypothetical protein
LLLSFIHMVLYDMELSVISSVPLTVFL